MAVEEYRPTERIVYLNGDSEMPVKVYDGQDGLGDSNTVALSALGQLDVYISRKDWKAIQRAVSEYFAEFDGEV
jgi:hypothetical protein